ncbi:hypothetical protein ABIB37_000329 [Agrococcus sp. UYP10]|uniref:DUF4349 domain-containing protein n=1 Tax=Agrococcus sp. UYP10 TaxID=1756355 RepID=UPI003391AC8B
MTRRLLSMAGIVVVGAVLLTGCGAMGASQSPVVGAPAQEGGGQDGGVPDLGGSPAEEPSVGIPGAGEDLGGVAGDEDRSVIISGTLSMRVGDPIATADAVSDAAVARGGAIDRRSEGASTEFEPAWATLTVRVPAAEVETMLTALRELGEVTRVDMGEEQVTAQVRDLEVRVNAARTSVDRLTQLLTTAADTETLLEVEAQLTERTSELEQLRSQQRALEDLVAMSTIGVDIRSTTVEGPTGTPSFWDGLVAGWGAFLAWGAAALFALGQAVPTLIVLAVLGLVVWLIVRRALKRRPQRATVAGPSVENPATPTPVQ